MNRLAIIFFGSLCLMGCSSLSVSPVTKRVFGKEPESDKVVQATVGDTIYQESDYTVYRGALVARPFSYMVSTMTVKGPLALMTDSEGREYYCGFATYTSFGKNQGDISVCLRDSDHKGAFDTFATLEPYATATLSEPLPYIELPEQPSSGYKQELVYEGVSGNTVHFQYREYSQDFARPAFAQSVSYTLDSPGPTEGRFKGLTLRILSANNNGIKYSVSGTIRR